MQTFVKSKQALAGHFIWLTFEIQDIRTFVSAESVSLHFLQGTLSNWCTKSLWPGCVITTKRPKFYG